MASNDLSLPVEKLQEWAAELRRLEAEIARLNKEREGYLEKIHAVRLIFGNVPAAAASLSSGSAEGATFTSIITETLENAEGGMTPRDLAKVLESSALGDRFRRNPNAIYTAIGRLVERGVLARRGKHVYSTAVLEKLGDDYEEPPQESEKISVRDLILKILSDAKKALAAGEIMDEVKKVEEFRARIDANPQYGYQNLSRMAQRGQIERRGKLYALPSAASLPSTD